MISRGMILIWKKIPVSSNSSQKNVFGSFTPLKKRLILPRQRPSVQEIEKSVEFQIPGEVVGFCKSIGYRFVMLACLSTLS